MELTSTLLTLLGLVHQHQNINSYRVTGWGGSKKKMILFRIKKYRSLLFYLNSDLGTPGRPSAKDQSMSSIKGPSE